MTFFRSFNPVWNFRGLTGLPLDDTYYAFFLENDIPYIPQNVYNTPSGTILANPVQLTAAGTLPVDVFFDADLVYRIEIRAGNTQADALIWLIENYTPDGTGGGGSITNTLSSDNQITNPQFSLLNFESSLSITSAGTYEVAPGWSLVLAGAGMATVTREALTSAEPNPTNAPYALRLALSGWTSGTGTYLAQRFNHAGMLWSSTSTVDNFVSSSITTKLACGANTNISATLVDSNATTLATILPVTTLVNQTYTERAGSATMPVPSNPMPPGAAWVEYRLIIPGTIDILVTSFQVISSATSAQLRYEQETIERQVDHTYHLAYPIVPIGSLIDFMGFEIPAHYFDCNGDAKNRVTYELLFNAITKRETVAITSGVATFTVASITDLWIGMALEGDGIQVGATILSLAGTTVTMDLNADDTGNFVVRFFAAGVGDGSTTFGLPDLRDYVVAGSGGELFGVTNNGIGKKDGASSHEIKVAELPPHTHTTAVPVAASSGGGAVAISGPFNLGAPQVITSSNGSGISDPMTIVQQTALARKLIRFE